MKGFLPISKKEAEDKGWDYVDFVLISGDAYVDHPSFGTAIIGRTLESAGFRVGIIAQPDWRIKESIDIFGEPRLGFLVTGGNIDSMVNHYTVAKKSRQTDSYSPGGRIGCRPDRATIVYGNLIRQTYKQKPIILGGIEASLRRLAHYDYWDDKIRRSILMDAAADLLVYGMGEKAIVEIAEGLAAGLPIEQITYVKGTAYRSGTTEACYDYIMLEDYETLLEDKMKYAESFMVQTREGDFAHGKTLVESYGSQGYVIVNPPMRPLTQLEFDDAYDLPYERKAHPIYKEEIPAIKEVKFSIISNRGCFGDCNFCALTFHQGRILQARSHTSILKEAKRMTEEEDFKGFIHDVGGPTANFRQPSCEKQLSQGTCRNKECLGTSPCKNLKVSHKDYLQLLRALKQLPKVKKVFIRSGIRFDYLIYDSQDDFFRELVKDHISGQLKVAPEHVSDRVLEKMGKPYNKVYNSFTRKYERLNKEMGKKQFLVPYLMSSHPGSTLEDAIMLSEFLRDHHLRPQQVQDFYPTPSTLSTVMYYTEIDPKTKEKVYVPKNPHEKAMQRALIQYKDPANYRLVREALILSGREDLVGYGEHCLIPPRPFKKKNEVKGKNNRPKEVGMKKVKTRKRPSYKAKGKQTSRH